MNSTKKPIKGKVAKVLNTRELVLNIGEINGVEIGMYFDVLDPNGENIKDPDTGETLGSVERPKVRVKISSTKDNLSIGTTFRKKQINIGGIGTNLDFGFSKLFMPPKMVEKYETFKTDEQTWEELPEEKSIVKIGDPVIEVENIEDED